MKVKLKKYKYGNALLLLAFYVLLSILHFNYIIDFQDFKFIAYYDKIEFSFTPIRYFIASTAIGAYILILLVAKVSDFMYAMLILILFFFLIPSALVFSSGYVVYPAIFILHNFLFLFVYAFSFIDWKFKTPAFNTKQSLYFLFAISLVGIIPFVVEYGPYINIKNLLLIDIYKTRSLVTENISNLYTAYTYSWFSKIIIPILVVLCIYHRKYIKLTITAALLAFLFLCGAHKMVFAGLGLLFIFYKYDYVKKIRYFIGFIVSLLVISLAASILFDYDYIWDISFRRALMLTALLDYCYFDFFQGNPLYYSHSFLSSFIEYPYELTPDNMIGKVYYGRPEANVNIGIISDGYKNLGILGSFLNIIIVAVYISILNYLKISPKFFGLFVLLIFSFLNSSLTTILLTHGGFVLMILAIFALRNTQSKMV